MVRAQNHRHTIGDTGSEKIQKEELSVNEMLSSSQKSEAADWTTISQTWLKVWISTFDLEYFSIIWKWVRTSKLASISIPVGPNIESRLWTFDVSSCVLNEFMSSRGTLHPYLALRFYPKKKKGKLSCCVCQEINKRFQKKGIKDHLNLDDDEVEKCQPVTNFNNRPENKE